MIIKIVKKQIKRIDSSLGRNIALRRELIGKSQEEFAEAIGIGISTLKDIERGVSGGSPKTRSVIAKGLGCSADDLSLAPIKGPSNEPVSMLQLAVKSDSLATKSDEILTILKERLPKLSPALQTIAKHWDSVDRRVQDAVLLAVSTAAGDDEKALEGALGKAVHALTQLMPKPHHHPRHKKVSS